MCSQFGNQRASALRTVIEKRLTPHVHVSGVVVEAGSLFSAARVTLQRKRVRFEGRSRPCFGLPLACRTLGTCQTDTGPSAVESLHLLRDVQEFEKQVEAQSMGETYLQTEPFFTAGSHVLR